ncbi:MAG: hypothetical protein H7321_00100 [Bacteroidia bacterium]|nr:hypothetical protein [Bacteroidia bacterium]
MTEEILAQYIRTLQLDMNMFKDSLKEVSDDIIKEGFSKHPIFVAHQEDVKLGEEILNREEIGSQFTYQASTLEEFMERGIIEKSKKADFERTFKDPSKHCCIFLVTQYGASFVFVPFESAEPKPSKD